jgi:hypothetical protein
LGGSWTFVTLVRLSTYDHINRAAASSDAPKSVVLNANISVH